MIETIRLNTFETNSSSMHAITVCPYIEDVDYLKNELERWKQSDGSYDITVELDEDKLDDGSFTIRGYIPHKSLNDKLIYVFATICQHYNSLIHSMPDKPNRDWCRNDEQYKERLTNWEKEFNEWKEKGYTYHNHEILKQFQSYLKDLSENFSWKVRWILFGNEPKYHYIINENGKEEYVPKTPDTRPEVKLTFKYIIDEDCSILPTSEDNWFSTGCYGNEEFFFACCSSYYELVYWLINPYNQILAGGDEMDDEQYITQRKEAKRLIDESWKKFSKQDDLADWEPILNPGKVIWPVGG